MQNILHRYLDEKRYAIMLNSIPLPTILQPVGEKRVTFHHLNWQAYQQILQALGNNRAAPLVAFTVIFW
ncbi:MAG: hypothetical protein F6K31_01830 [Symploca sp. SIO2G7]|nr:hypothetical protein [Symploca sp. SIO2G7]